MLIVNSPIDYLIADLRVKGSSISHLGTLCTRQGTNTNVLVQFYEDRGTISDNPFYRTTVCISVLTIIYHYKVSCNKTRKITCMDTNVCSNTNTRTINIYGMTNELDSEVGT